MNTEWLMDFIVLSEVGNFSRAAEQRAVTHTAFGRRIKQLEAWVGAPLVNRQKPISLTREGHVFLAVAQEVTENLNNVRMQFQQTAPAALKSVSIATGRTLGSKFFPQWYRALMPKTGFIRMSMVTGGAGQTVQYFIDEKADLLLVYQTPITDALLSQTAFVHKIVGKEIIVPVTADANMASMDLFDTQGAGQINWLNYDKSLSLKGVILPFLTQKQLFSQLNPVFEADNYDTMKEMVLAGVGIAWLPMSTVSRDMAKKRLFVLRNKSLQTTVNIILFKRATDQDAQLNEMWEKIEASDLPCENK